MKYFLLSSQRSGSDLLRHLLLNVFGEHSDGPDEWIMHHITRKNLGLPKDFNTANELILKNVQLLIDRMSDNSHRKVMYNHILNPYKIPKKVLIIHLIRKDSWAQAKSLLVMKQKRVPPHVNEDTHKQLLNQNIKIHLNINEVRDIAKKMLNQKQFWYQALVGRSNTLTLYYEDDLSDITIFKHETITKIEEFLGRKRIIEDFNFPFKKTSSLYTIENLKEFDEQNDIKEFYFNPNAINKRAYLKMKLKLMLNKGY